MHRCLYIPEVLTLIFKSVERPSRDHRGHQNPQVCKKTLATLARTCHWFSSPALDLLWQDLYSINPLIKIFPFAVSAVDDPRWLTFHNYAKRVKVMHSSEESTLARIKQGFISSLQHCPKIYLPLLPNVTELEWSEFSDLFPSPEGYGISLLRYFGAPTVTTITLSLARWTAYSSTELAVLADLPRLCPEVTAFTLVTGLGLRIFREAGTMVTQWPSLRTLRTCAIEQSVMDALFSTGTLESLHIDFNDSSPLYNGRIPDTILDFALGAQSPSLCRRFLESVYASPTRFRLLICIHEGREKENTKIFRLLPHHLDASRLLSLTIQPEPIVVSRPMPRAIELEESLVPLLVGFTALKELDLDFVCTAQLSDADFANLTESLTQLRSLKLGTMNKFVTLPWPIASVGAVVTVLTNCKHLETLHIAFDGLSLPPGYSITEDDEVTLSEELVTQGWGVSNTRITKLCVGYSPIGEATIDAIASCLKSIMPRLVQIECKARHEEWNLVEEILGLS